MPTPRPPTPTALRFVRYIAGFSVGVALGTAPFLGKTAIPGFDALLGLFPRDLQATLIPMSAFAMGVVAVAVQGQGDAKDASLRRLRTLFRRTLVLLLILFLTLVVLYTKFVVRVPVGAAGATAAVVVSSQRLPTCLCTAPSDLQCIEELSLKPAAIESCWGSRPLRNVRLGLSLVYLGLTSGFGALVGLLILFPEARKTRPPAKPREAP